MSTKFDALTVPTIRQMFVDRITQMILSGELKIGDVLPTERELAQEMRISKSAAHLGLSDLQRLGFVHIKPRHHTIVADYWSSGTLETLNTILRHNGGRLSKARTRSVLECRMALEGIALERVALNHTEEDLVLLRGVAEKLRQLAGREPQANRSELSACLFDFSHTISECSDNSIFPLLLNAFRFLQILYWDAVIDLFGVEKPVQYIEYLLSCIENKDAASAKARMQREFEDYLEKI
jgi:GntR family transcriptional repressor for pyruvate dehydrogenase complex